MKTICIDFDGVLHSYETGWTGANFVNDEPVHGAIEWLEKMINESNMTICIYSSRSSQSGGINAMQNWLLKHGLDPDDLACIEFPINKPAAFLTIDDRAICFKGEFPSIDEIDKFKPWNKGD